MIENCYNEGWIKGLSENDFRINILIPLFRVSGFYDVYDYHGSQEYGKDIVMFAFAPTKTRDDYAVAVILKTKKIKGNTSRDVSAISTQINPKHYQNHIWIKSQEKKEKIYKKNNNDDFFLFQQIFQLYLIKLKKPDKCR